MHARTAALLGAALLVGLAGCAGVLPGTSDTSYPSGTDADGVTNASTVLSTHQSQLAADSYRIRYELLYDQPGGPPQNSTSVVESNATQGRQLHNNILPGRQVGSFLDGDQSFSRIQLDNRTIYDTQPVSENIDSHHEGAARPGRLLRTVVGAANYTANGTVERDGRTLRRFSADQPVANATGQLPADVQQFNATILIDDEGRIWRGDLFATGETNGTSQVYYEEYQIVDAGNVSVQRPAWVDQATES